jgi:hypothetical protein
VLLLLLLAPSCLRANDTAATLGAGGLTAAKSSQIAMQSEDLHISLHTITIRYVFRNTSDKDITTLVAFPLPALDGVMVANSPVNIPDLRRANFVDFSVTSHGRQIPVSMSIRAMSGGQNVTARLRQAGLSGNVLLQPLNHALLHVPKAVREELERQQLLVADEFNPPLPGTGKKGWWAMWSMHVSFYWKQRFPARSTVELVQSYRPVVGGSYVLANQSGKASLAGYCGTPHALQQIVEEKERHPLSNPEDIAYYERKVDYILTTANNWEGPIGHFRLTIATDSPDEILSSCMSGLRRMDATHYEAIRTHFRPARNLQILILQPPRLHSRNTAQ